VMDSFSDMEHLRSMKPELQQKARVLRAFCRGVLLLQLVSV